MTAALPFVGHAEPQRRFIAIQYAGGQKLVYKDTMSGAVYPAPTTTTTIQQLHNSLLAGGAVAFIGHPPSAF